MKYVKRFQKSKIKYKEDMAVFQEKFPDAKELLTKAKYMFTLHAHYLALCILTNFGCFFHRKMKRKQKSVICPATIGEGAAF